MEDMLKPTTLQVKKASIQAKTLQDFEIKAMIGKGAFGKVFLAEL